MNAPSSSPINSPSTDSLYELVEQLTERWQRGEAVDLSQVMAAHPEHAERLQQVLPALAVLADIHVASTPAPAGAGSARRASEALDGLLGDFRIVREIGRGGMGVVYEARQISLDRRVALKVLPFAGVLDARQLQRFTNEARAAAGLHHPNIVPVYAVGCERGVHYYAMQYIDGQTLADVIRELRPASQGRKSLGAFAVGNAIAAVKADYHSEAMTNDENQMSKEIPNPKSEIRNDLSSATDELPSTRQASATNPGANAPGSPGSPRTFGSLGSPDASTLRLLDTSTPSRVRFRTTAEWGIQIAEALDYAHSVGVIHRDIKPANLMLDSQGRVWITDFGLAQIETDAGLTMTGDIVGTLRYMSPEQALGERGLVDQRTDVYSLGLALYELLTLQPAFGDANRRELLRRISTEDPAPPRRIIPAIPVELETIVQKATEKDAAARYATARDLAADLRRYLQEQPIKARPATRFDKCKKWMRRNPVLAKTSIAFAFVAAVGLTAAIGLVDHERQKTLLEKRARAAEQQAAAVAQAAVRINRYVASINLAAQAHNLGNLSDVRQHLDNCRPGDGEDDLRSFEWHYLRHVARDIAPAFAGHQGDVYCFQLSRDGRTAATGGKDGARVWNYATGSQITHLTAHNSDVNGVGFSPDGTMLATAGDDHSAKIWNTSDWQLLRSIPHVGDVVAAAFTPDGRLLATGERHYYVDPGPRRVGENVVRLWDTETWEPRGELRGDTGWLHSVAISDDGTLLATGNLDGTACLWDVASGALLQQLRHGSAVQWVAFAHRRPLLAVIGGDALIKMWRIPDGTLEDSFRGARVGADGMAFAPDDSAIVACGNDHGMQFWELAPGGQYQRHTVFRTSSRVWSAAFVDKTTVITTQGGGAVRRWDLLRGSNRYRISLQNPRAPDFAFSPDGKSLVTAAGKLRVHNLAAQSQISELPLPNSSAFCVAFSPDGKTVVAGYESADVMLWDSESWLAARKFEYPNLLYEAVNYMAGGQIIAISERTFIDPITGKLVPSPFPVNGKECSILFAPHGAGAALLNPGSAGIWGSAEIWNSDRRLWEIPEWKHSYEAHAIAPDCLRFASSYRDGAVRIWNAADEKSEFLFVGDSEPIRKLAFTPDGRTLAGVTTDFRIKLWNVATGRELLNLSSGLSKVRKLSFSPDGSSLAVSGNSIAHPNELVEVIVWQTGSDE